MRAILRLLVPSLTIMMGVAQSAQATEAPGKCYYWYVSPKVYPQLQVSLLEMAGLMPCAELVNEVIKSCEAGPAQGMVSCIQKVKPLDQRISTDPYFRQGIEKDQDLQTYFQEHQDYMEEINHTKVSNLFNGPSGTNEGYTIGEHTERVLDIYEKQKTFYRLDTMGFPSYVQNRDRFMKYLILYHDIGKSISATVYGNNSHEIQYSYPLAWRLMLNSNFTSKEANLAIGLIYRHKVIGDYLQGKITDVETVVSELRETARNTGTTLPQFFDLLHLLYVADAGSYPGLLNRVFGLVAEQETSELKMDVISSPERYRALKAAIGIE